MSSDQKLPSKESGLFKQIVRFYETKQYKKGVKAADQILKKIPDHGETMSMKALIISNLGNERKAEAHDLAKQGLRETCSLLGCFPNLRKVSMSFRARNVLHLPLCL